MAGAVVVEVSEDRSTTVDDLHIIFICGAEEGVKATTFAMAARHTTEHRALLIIVMYGKWKCKRISSKDLQDIMDINESRVIKQILDFGPT